MDNENKVLYTYKWEFTNENEVNTFKYLQRLALYQGVSIEYILYGLVDNYNSRSRNVPNFTMATEKEIMSCLKLKGYNVTRQMIKSYRDKGYLQGLKDSDDPHWYHQGKYIVYNLEKTIDFITNYIDTRESGSIDNANK